MNNDLISRQQAFDALHCHFADGFEEDRWWNSTHVIAALKGLPPAQPECKGWWIEHENADIVDGYYVSKYECSCCHTWKDDNSDYCPDCGADMRGKKDEAD